MERILRNAIEVIHTSAFSCTELFEVEENTGFIRALSSLSETDQTKYSLGVDVTDGTHLTTSVIDIIIVPENSEESFESASYSFSVKVSKLAIAHKAFHDEMKIFFFFENPIKIL